MSKKHKYIFVFLCLFPFMLAMGFRAADDYRFTRHLESLKKSRPEYFPKEPPKDVMGYKLTCYKKKAPGLSDSLGVKQVETGPLSTYPKN